MLITNAQQELEGKQWALQEEKTVTEQLQQQLKQRHKEFVIKEYDLAWQLLTGFFATNITAGSSKKYCAVEKKEADEAMAALVGLPDTQSVAFIAAVNPHSNAKWRNIAQQLRGASPRARLDIEKNILLWCRWQGQ